METTKFDKLGAFPYSKEEGTPAAKLPEQIHGNTKKARYRKLMELQAKIAKQKLTDKIGKEVKVLIEDISFDKKYFIGRTMQDVPEMDGLVYMQNDAKGKEEEIINHFVVAKIIEASNYDLVATLK